MKNSKLLIPILTACALLCACNNTATRGLSFGDINHVNSSYTGFVKSPVQQETYYIDETISIGPKDIVYNNKVYSCSDFYVIFPDGSQKTGTKFKLTLEGEYRIVYIAESGEKTIEAVETIYAYKRAYSVGKDTSTSQYVDSIICEQKVPTGGIQTYLAEGDTWTYNQPIDISKANLDQPIIKYYTRQSSELADHVSLDVTSTIIRLTDFYDSSNYVEIYNIYNETNQSTHRMQPYVLAGCNGQPLSGIDPNNKSSKTISYEGNNYYLHNSNKNWGACLDTVPGAIGINGTRYNPDIANSDNRGFSVYFDANKLTISVRHNLMHLVTDLDEPAIYSNNLFKGFTTGEVILSMRCEGYQESQGFFEISEINGKKGSELNTNYAYDEVAPFIQLNNKANNFFIACDEPFELFTATATDPNLVGDVSCQVFYDYGTSNQRFIPVSNNCFTPTSVGLYSIVYTAKDKYGNVTNKIVTCNCIRAANNHIVNLDFDPVKEADAGTYVSLPTPVVTSYNEGAYYKIKAINEANNDVVDLNNDNLHLFLKYAGDYKILVEYGDISCSKVKEYAFKSNPSNRAYLESTVLPRYFIKDTYSSLDNNRVVLCNDTKPSYAEPSIYVKNDNALDYETSPIDPKNFMTTANESVSLKYVYNGQTIYETEAIPVIDVDYFGCPEFARYFDGDLTSVINDDGVSFNTTEVGGDREVTFINPLSFSLFRLELVFDSKLRFKTIDLIMEDYYGVEDDFVLSFFFNGNILCFLNNGIKGEIGVVDYASLAFDSTSGVLSLGQGVSINIGNLFPNDKMYLSFRVTDVKAGTTKNDENKIFTIKSINNQILSSMAYGGDYNPPQVSYTSLKGQRNIGEVIHIKRSYVCDVLSPFYAKTRMVKVTYATSISDNAPAVVTSIDGVKLDGTQDLNRDYDVLLDKHGVYRIIYYYQDQSYQDVSLTETIYVEDNEAPVIIIDGADSKTVDIVSFGSEVTIRGYKVEDQNNFTVSIFAISPQNTLIRLEGKKFTPDMKGDWRIVYFASDENGNVSSVSYILRVK